MEAQELRRAAVLVIDANIAQYGGRPRGTLAAALLLDGRKDAALDTPSEAFRSGDYKFWWYTLKYDPLWLPLHGDPRFQAIPSDVQRYVDAQRSQLKELRRLGNVPNARTLTISRGKPRPK